MLKKHFVLLLSMLKTVVLFNILYTVEYTVITFNVGFYIILFLYFITFQDCFNESKVKKQDLFEIYY